MTEHIEELAPSDTQLLEETIVNERIVSHSKLGQIRLRMPTLDITRKIEAVARSKRKMLKEAKDTVTDEEGNTKVVQAYKSREQLEREYVELGWWTENEKLKLAKLSEQHIQLLSELEGLGFESDALIYGGIAVIKIRLEELCKDDTTGDLPEEVAKAIETIISPGATVPPSVVNVIKNHSSTTEIDDLIAKLINLHKQYNTYIKLAKVYSELVELRSQEGQLFSDSWQEQLQYYIRLAQVFYCSEKVVDNKPIWTSIKELEAEQDVDLIRWVFAELNAFWQGWTEDTREKMDKYSFTNPRGKEQSPSESSPAPQESSLGGEPQESKP